MNANAASALLVALLVSASAFAGAAAAASGATLEIRPESGSATATYAATVGVDENGVGALDAFEMRLDAAGVSVSSVPPRAVTAAGIDRGGDQPGTAVDVSVRDDLSGVSVHGNTVEVYFDGTNQLRAGDELVVVVAGLPTPAPGTYTVPMGLNEPGERRLQNAEVTVSGSGGAATGTAGPTGASATAGATEATETETGGADAVELTSSPVPGFGATAAAVAVLAAAACAARVSRRR